MGSWKHDKVSKMKKAGLGVLGIGVLAAGIWSGAGNLQSSALAQTSSEVTTISNVPVPVASAAKNVSLANVVVKDNPAEDYIALDKTWVNAAAHIRGKKEVESKKAYTPEYAAHLERLAVKQKEEKQLGAKRAKQSKLLADPEYQLHLKRLANKTDPAYQAHLTRLAAKQNEDREYQEHLVRLAQKNAGSEVIMASVPTSVSSRPDYDPETGEVISIYDRAVDQIPRFNKTANPRTQNLLARLSGNASSYKDVSTMNNAIAVEATGYVADCIGCSGITASGLDVRYSTPQVIAVDPSVIPLGTNLDIWVEGVYFGVYKASDTGGMIKGNRIDILFETANDAVRFGRRSAIVKVHDGPVRISQPAKVVKPTQPTVVTVAAKDTKAASPNLQAAKQAKLQAVKLNTQKKEKADAAKKAAQAKQVMLKNKAAEQAKASKAKAKEQLAVQEKASKLKEQAAVKAAKQKDAWDAKVAQDAADAASAKAAKEKDEARSEDASVSKSKVDVPVSAEVVDVSSPEDQSLPEVQSSSGAVQAGRIVQEAVQAVPVVQP